MRGLDRATLAELLVARLPPDAVRYDTRVTGVDAPAAVLHTSDGDLSAPPRG